MKTTIRALLGATILATSLSSVAMAQVFTGSDVADQRNEDLLEGIEDDAERDLDRFGNEGLPQGFSGSFALRTIASTGNTDSIDLGAGTDLNYVSGLNGFELQLNYAYGEDDGVKNEESLYYDFQYTRDFTSELFGFAKVQGSVDEFSAFDTDTFASIGAGYRIFNEADRQWSVQAGPGYRFAELDDLTRGDIDEAAFGFSSDFAQRLSPTTSLTNDTDIIGSETDTVVFNDLAVSVAMTNQLALRTSILTEYHTDPAPGFDNTDNTIGISLVYTFN